MAKEHKYWRGRNELAQSYYKTRYQEVAKEKGVVINNVGDYTVAVFNLSKNINPKLPMFAGSESLGKEGIEAREVEKALGFKSSINSGRYLANRNKIFVDNYIKAINDLSISPEKKNEFIDRIRDVPTNSIEILASMLPDLNFWYERISNDSKISSDDISYQIEDALISLGLYNEEN